MNFIGNIAWLLFGGFITALMYWIFGILFCITIIGIPLGIKHFQIAGASIFPFGQKIFSR